MKTTFEWSVIGHKNIVDFLQRSIINKKINQSYLFIGQSYLGKKTLAYEFISSLVCANQCRDKKLPCRQCPYCRQVIAGTHPDVYRVDVVRDDKTGKLNKEIKIKQIRELQEKLSHRSFLKSYKVALIDNADALSEEAANALLKTLEEPTPKTVLILVAQSESNLLPTIVSRCQKLKFFPVANKLIFNHLLTLQAPRKLADNLTRLAAGRPGIAINFFNSRELYDEYKSTVERLIDILSGKISDRFKIVAELTLKNGRDFSEQINMLKDVLEIWKGVVRDLLLLKNSNSEWLKNRFIKLRLEKLSSLYSVEKLADISSLLDNTSRYLALNINPKLAFENLVVSF